MNLSNQFCLSLAFFLFCGPFPLIKVSLLAPNFIYSMQGIYFLSVNEFSVLSLPEFSILTESLIILISSSKWKDIIGIPKLTEFKTPVDEPTGDLFIVK